MSQALLHYHFETKAKLFESTMNDLAQTLFANASAHLPSGKSVRDGFTEAADLLYTHSSTISTRPLSWSDAPPHQITPSFCEPRT